MSLVFVGRSRWSVWPAFVLAWFCLALAFALSVFPGWLDHYFGHVTFDQVIFQVEAGYDSLFSADPKLIRRFWRGCVLNPAILALGVMTLVWRFGGWKSRLLALVLAWGMASVVVYKGFDVATYVLSHADGDLFAAQYVDPSAVTVADPRRKRNLVLIYVESLESTYGNEALFGRNLLSPLTPFESRGRRFAHLRQTPGTGWTTAGLVASQCGVPLKVFGLWNKNRQGEDLQAFLPNATCLGDLLSKHGYQNVFMNGADLKFSGVGKFFASHGYQERWGRDEWIRLGYPGGAFHDWGLPDDQLMLQARRRLHELMQLGQPFNLTLLTIDTHGPDGFPSPTCEAWGQAGDFPHKVTCAARLVAGLLSHIHEQGWDDDIRVVVLGDHLAMKNPLSGALDHAAGRSPYNLFYPSGKPELTPSDISYFDVFPSVLAFLGFTVPGGRLGLGWDALSGNLDVDTPDRWVNLDRMPQNSTRYEKLWGFE